MGAADPDLSHFLRCCDPPSASSSGTCPVTELLTHAPERRAAAISRLILSFFTLFPHDALSKLLSRRWLRSKTKPNQWPSFPVTPFAPLCALLMCAHGTHQTTKIVGDCGRSWFSRMCLFDPKTQPRKRLQMAAGCACRAPRRGVPKPK